MKDTIQKLNDVLGHLTAISFERTETSKDLEKPLNDLSEAISEFENLNIANVSQQSVLLSDLEKWLDRKENNTYYSLPVGHVIERFKSLNFE
jgi:hypothetical protein